MVRSVPGRAISLRRGFRRLGRVCRKGVRLTLTTRCVVSGLFRRQLRGSSLLPFRRKGRCLLIRASCFGPPVRLLSVLRHVREGNCCPLLTRPRQCRCVQVGSCGVLGSGRVSFRLGVPSLIKVCNGRVRGGTGVLLGTKVCSLKKGSIRSLVFCIATYGRGVSGLSFLGGIYGV